MKFTIVVQSAPFSSQSALTAWQFATEVLKQGHSIDKVFFYADGVHNATMLLTPPEDEFNLVEAWQQLNSPKFVCVAAALRRGVINQVEAKRWQKEQFNLADGFELAGLGELSEALLGSDRVINFGG